MPKRSNRINEKHFEGLTKMKSLLNCFYILTILFQMSELSFAQTQQVAHVNCQIHLGLTGDKDGDALLDTAAKELRKRGYGPIQSDLSKIIGKKQLYLNLSKESDSKSFYPPCRATLVLLETTGEKTSSKDKELFRYSSMRSVPRTTPKSMGRCHLAVHDAFGFFPTCIINSKGIDDNTKEE
jgi:hypothetical protein